MIEQFALCLPLLSAVAVGICVIVCSRFASKTKNPPAVPDDRKRSSVYILTPSWFVSSEPVGKDKKGGKSKEGEDARGKRRGGRVRDNYVPRKMTSKKKARAAFHTSEKESKRQAYAYPQASNTTGTVLDKVQTFEQCRTDVGPQLNLAGANPEPVKKTTVDDTCEVPNTPHPPIDLQLRSSSNRSKERQSREKLSEMPGSELPPSDNPGLDLAVEHDTQIDSYSQTQDKAKRLFTEGIEHRIMDHSTRDVDPDEERSCSCRERKGGDDHLNRASPDDRKPSGERISPDGHSPSDRHGHDHPGDSSPVAKPLDDLEDSHPHRHHHASGKLKGKRYSKRSGRSEAERHKPKSKARTKRSHMSKVDSQREVHRSHGLSHHSDVRKSRSRKSKVKSKKLEDETWRSTREVQRAKKSHHSLLRTGKSKHGSALRNHQ